MTGELYEQVGRLARLISFYDSPVSGPDVADSIAQAVIETRVPGSKGSGGRFQKQMIPSEGDGDGVVGEQ